MALEDAFTELRAAPARRGQPSAPPVPSWALLAASLVGAVSVVGWAAIVRRRRVPRFIVPDAIPDDLEKREPALRS